MNNYWNGAAVNLRRNDTNATQDIGFNGCGFDWGAAQAFCSGTTCYGTRWYDQDGNGNDLAESANSNQPKYVAHCDKTFPCFQFASGTNTVMSVALKTAVGANTLAIVGGVTNILTSGTFAYSGNYLTPTYNTRMTYATSGLVNSVRTYSGTSQVSPSASAIAANSFYRVCSTVNSSLSHISVSGASGADNTTPQTLNPYAGFYVGNNSSNNSAGNVNMIEAVLFSPDISNADAATIGANQATYYGVP